MWFEKALDTYSKRFLFLTYFFDRYGYNEVKILDKKEMNGLETYVVEANYHVKERVCKFYINDFSIKRDVMENSSYAIKDNNELVDADWAGSLSFNLPKEEQKQYKKEFKEYHKKVLEEKNDWLKTF